jgi:hypothetical protein
MIVVLLKYLTPHLNPVEDVSDGKTKLQVLHTGCLLFEWLT